MVAWSAVGEGEIIINADGLIHEVGLWNDSKVSDVTLLDYWDGVIAV